MAHAGQMEGTDMTEPNVERGETDVEQDDKVASSRANEGDDGEYVGRTTADDDFDAGQTGAEARSD